MAVGGRQQVTREGAKRLFQSSCSSVHGGRAGGPETKLTNQWWAGRTWSAAGREGPSPRSGP